MIYESTIIKATLKRPTYTKTVAVQTGTVKDPETKEDIPVYEDQEQVEFIENAPLEMDIPFRVYGQNLVAGGQDITYDLHNLDHDGKTVIAKVDYRVEADPKNPWMPAEKDKVDKYAGTLGQEWDKIKADADLTKEWTLKKEDALATYDKDGNKIKYDGADKLDPVPFCKWEGQVKVVEPVDEPIKEKL